MLNAKVELAVQASVSAGVLLPRRGLLLAGERGVEFPRLRSMDPDKIKQMEQLADQARNTPQDKLLPLLMSLRGSNGSPQFSTSEMDTLFSILTDQMPPAQKRQAEMLRMLSRQMGGANKS